MILNNSLYISGKRALIGPAKRAHRLYTAFCSPGPRHACEIAELKPFRAHTIKNHD